MNQEQMEELILANGRDIAAAKESLKSAHKRIDENDALTKQVCKLAASIETLAYQVKVQGDRVEEMIRSQQDQGKRIGALEIKPGVKWEALVRQLTGLAVAAAFGALMAKFM